ncbi:MAG: hypothetical protein UHD04_07375 [Muribaculaceae bacterium]|jgi:hypothetical protein|nr:hypothetical protein [Muribaculaceae bacterium]
MKYYKIGGHSFKIEGCRLTKAITDMTAFTPFEIEETDTLFSFSEGENSPIINNVIYKFSYEDVEGIFGSTNNGYALTLKPSAEEALQLWLNSNESSIVLCGNLSVKLFRFALWMGYNLKVLPFSTAAIHSSCITFNNKAILFLGESGTGKSTHTRLWYQNIPNAKLLNDDSPIVRYVDNKLWVYGSPWSGKTACYKNEKYEIAAIVRLSQAPSNHIKRLSTLESYGALHPSFPPGFAYDNTLYEHIGNIIGECLTHTPVFHLQCLPNVDAALLCKNTIYKI